ncbi:TRAP transporter large permease [Rhodoplanes sp. TEM]|uniref:TRAP transporter large permease n=1 Tax=Rhodoplanes tepidamans TaxID=200616 RepID=A0ABT5J7Q2_RHOTP|nr:MULTISPECIES: TRAP transporter large permease [Rhodoplanes]MDC7785687.1 TRAP transporter large permease [Rhodoplanes tepidamans]MDC7983328.1 TRAP transporter large permease [Rhodoplanes sp. TEM]MDQ0354745.1 tripartite ATP-independent transporter DctM subunit [Rhodoplanes tepidamans]
MFGHSEMLIVILVVLALVFAGVHIAVALGITAAFGIWLMLGDVDVVRTFVANTAYEALRDYVFAVIPLFMLMGDLLAKCGAARDIYALGHRFSKWLPAQLAAATIVSNALFGFVTGVSIAAAAAFSRIAYPEMKRYGYRRDFALGCVAGSACLGMLIPPSVLMIVWAVLTEVSIGKLFLAGVIPGFLAAGGMILYVVIAAKLNPALVGGPSKVMPRAAGVTIGDQPTGLPSDEPLGPLLRSTGLVVALVIGVLAAIWLGLCTPTEGAGLGAVGALVLAMIKGIRPREIRDVVLDVGRTSGPLLLLLFCAQLYSRVLSMTGFTEVAKSFLLATGLGAWGILVVMVGIWLVLGCLIDSISIILLTVPIFAPIAAHLGFDPLAFAIIGILAIETGLLTPPFGILVFTVKAAVPDRSVELAEIFRGAIPYWFVLLAVVIAIALVPQLATWLPSL